MARGRLWHVGLMLAGAAVVLAACAAGEPSTPASAAAPTPDATAAWQSECLQATIRALEMERERYAGWLQQASGDQAAAYRRVLADIDAALAKYRHLAPEGFRIADAYRRIADILEGRYAQGIPEQPQPVVLDDAWVEDDLPGQIFYAGMSRSGPFYTVVGVRGGDLAALKPGVHYRVVLHPLMPATYPFPSFYVCVEQWEAVER